MSDRCPASAETISLIAKDLEQPKPITDGLQNLFVNDSLGVLAKEQRQDCLKAIASQNGSDQVAHTKELLVHLGATPNQTAHEGQILGQRITATDILPTVQISLGFEDKLVTHRPNLNLGENSPNGVWDTPFSEHKNPDGKVVLQFGDHKVPLE